MAVAAYAAVVSLIHVLDQIQNYPPPRLLHLDRDRIESLYEKVSFLQDFLEVHSGRFYAELEGLARQIAAVAAEAEDIIDSHVVDQLITQISAYESDINLSFTFEGIDNVIEKIESINKELMTLKEGMTIQGLGPRVSDPARSSTPQSSDNNAMVGFDDRLDQIIDELTRGKLDLQVLPIVGMGGIGKTTLARNAFENPYIKSHFDICTWLTISQDYSMYGILLGLLERDGDRKTKETGKSLADLGTELHKFLFERKYLIILDDVWDIDVWNELRLFIPDNKNASRIIVTTRLSPVADSIGSQTPFFMEFLDENKSWDLFHEKAFAKDGCCPPELEKVAKTIVKGCNGLPLAIVVIGGLLSKSNMAQEDWECIAKDVNSFANLVDDEHCLKILSLSYNRLPIHLKACFLQMREFLEDEDIHILRLITYWVAEGFLKPIKGKTLEEVAEEYLEDLEGRNLILTSRWGTNEKIKRCSMHDLLRDFCIRESHKEHFYCVPKIQIASNYRTMCFVCSSEETCTRIDLPRVVSLQQTSPAKCLVCDGCITKYPQLNDLRWLKMLDTGSYDDILLLTKLRVLCLSGYFQFVDSLMPLLWNLQLLYVRCDKDDALVLPSEIWELPQLRHLRTAKSVAVLPEPPLITEGDRKDSTIHLKNLQTLSLIKNFEWTDDAIERIPNLKDLGIYYDDKSNKGFIEWSYYSLHNLARLCKLESLLIETEAPLVLKKNITFPYSLKKLILDGCQIPWEEMTIIGSLPNLEVLKLFRGAFTGPDWNPIEGEFLRLKKLSIWQNYLKHWEAEKFHFPSLQHLKLESMICLEEIPSGIGEIEALRSINLSHCRINVFNSAEQI